MLLNKNLA